MFDFAWSELAVIGVVALVVIGPKDLPKALRTAGTMVRRARMMAREFQSSVGDMMREAEMDELRQSMRDLSPSKLKEHVINRIDPEGELKAALRPDAPAAVASPQPLPDPEPHGLNRTPPEP